MNNGKGLVVRCSSAWVVGEIGLTFRANSLGLLLQTKRVDDGETSDLIGGPESSLRTAVAIRNIRTLIGVVVVLEESVATQIVFGTSIIGVDGVPDLTSGALGGLDGGRVFSLQTKVNIQTDARI